MNWRASHSQLSKCWVRARKRINCQSMKPNKRHLLWQRCRELYPPSLVRIRKRKKMIVQLSGLKLPRGARSRLMTTFQKARNSENSIWPSPFMSTALKNSLAEIFPKPPFFLVQCLTASASSIADDLSTSKESKACLTFCQVGSSNLYHLWEVVRGNLQCLLALLSLRDRPDPWFFINY